jgi:hypothetical protein
MKRFSPVRDSQTSVALPIFARLLRRDIVVPLEQVRCVDLHVGAHRLTFVRLADQAWVSGQGQETIRGAP